MTFMDCNFIRSSLCSSEPLLNTCTLLCHVSFHEKRATVLQTHAVRKVSAQQVSHVEQARSSAEILH